MRLISRAVTAGLKVPVLVMERCCFGTFVTV